MYSPLENINYFENYRIGNSQEILHILEDIFKKKSLLICKIEDRSIAAVASILHVDRESNHIIVDGLKPFLGANQSTQVISVKTSQGNIPVLFRLSNAKSCLYEERSAFKIPVPQEIVRLQRREYVRIAPVEDRFVCLFRVSDNGLHPVELCVPVKNISNGGVGLLGKDMRLVTTPGHIHEGVSLMRNGKKILNFDLRICHETYLKVGSGSVINFGGEFFNLSTSTRGEIARMMVELERIYNSKIATIIRD